MTSVHFYCCFVSRKNKKLKRESVQDGGKIKKRGVKFGNGRKDNFSAGGDLKMPENRKMNYQNMPCASSIWFLPPTRSANNFNVFMRILFWMCNFFVTFILVREIDITEACLQFVDSQGDRVP